MSTTTITIIGFIITITLGISNLVLGKSNRFIGTVNNERVKWINKIRELFSEFNQKAYILGRKIDQDLFKELDESELMSTIVHLNNNIQLYLNPTEVLTKKLIRIQEEIVRLFLQSEINGFNYSAIEGRLLDLHFIQQVILKSEWKRIKQENLEGEEVSDYQMNEIFIRTAKNIDYEKFERLLKEDFESSPADNFYY
jgi:hypothetical protein